MRLHKLLALVFLVAAGTGADWPRFRGPNGTGNIDDPGVPVEFRAEHVLHKIAVPGRGYSSPVIAHGQLYLQTASDDGARRELICYNAQTLQKMWTATVSGGPGKTHAKNSLASSTPAADDQRVVALFWDGREIALHAFDRSGKPMWHVPLGSFSSQHGAGQSPILHGDTVFLNNDQDGRAELMAFDAHTGKRRWTAKRTAFRSSYTTPYIRQGLTGSELLVASTAGLAAYDLANGSIRWEWTWKFAVKPLRNVGSPVEGSGVILAVSGDGDGSRHMVGVAPPQEDKPATLAWDLKRGTPYVPGPLVRGDHVYCVTDKGFAMCLEARTGRIVYDERLTSGITASPLLVNGHVVCVDEGGTLFAYPATPKFQRPSRLALGEQVLASPAIADGRLFVRGERHLFVIGTNKTEDSKP